MNWAAIRVLYLRELRSALRERTIVINSILMPIFLYPVMLWVMFSAISFVQGVNEGFTSRVALVSPVPEGHGELLDSLQARSNIVFVDATAESVGEEGSTAPPVVAEDRALELLQAGDLDATLAFVPAAGGAAALPGNFTVRVRFDRTENRSESANSRIRGVVEDYRGRWLEREAASLQMSEEDRVRFAVTSSTISDSDDLGALLLGQMVSFFVVIMVALGCFVPSVDTTAGERERSTWETLMTVAAPRSSVVMAKYLYVATLGIVAGLLNVGALFLSVGAVARPLLEGMGGGQSISFALEPAAIPVMMAGAGALALFFAAAMMILASFARSFKDGQAMVQPVYWLVFLPFILGSQSDRTLTPAVAAIPVANVSMMIRDAINGVFIWPLIAQTLAVTLATVVACLLLARYVLRFEDFLMGSFDGSFWRFVKDRMGKGAPATAER